MIIKFILCGFLIMLMSSNMKLPIFAYYSRISDDYGRTHLIDAAPTIFALSQGLFSYLIGSLSHRWGTARILIFGTFFASVVLLALPGSENPISFVLLYGFCASFALTCISYVPLSVLIDQVSERGKTGFSYALVINGAAVGYVIFAPVWILAQTSIHWQDSFRYESAAFASLGIILLFVFREFSWRPNEAPCHDLKREFLFPRSAHWNSHEKRIFAILGAGFFCCGATMSFIDALLVPPWQMQNATSWVMASSLSVLGLLEIISGLIAGYLADGLHKLKYLGAFYSLKGLSFLLFAFLYSPLTAMTFCIVFGVSFLGSVVMTSAVSLEVFCSRRHGSIFGMLFLIHQIGGVIALGFGFMTIRNLHAFFLHILILSSLTLIAALACFATRYPLSPSLRTRRNGVIRR
ncbi:MAG: MFS transporter [Acetobacteraceae bacterium]